MADFKDNLSPELVAQIGRSLGLGTEFQTRAEGGLGDLELMDRVRWIAAALEQAMPSDPRESAAVIRSALADGGLDGWASMPVNAYVASAMLDRPDVALPLLAELTPCFTAEFAIRPFIDAQYEATMAQLREWTSHPDEHVRRLVSEGTRPRLPWAGRLPRFIEDPMPAIALLDRLFDDDSLYVRRSVANHLNDIAKDHPGVALATARRWAGASTHGDYVVRHGMRTLVKQGNPDALGLLGFDSDVPVAIEELACAPSSIEIGDETTLAFSLRAERDARVVIDYVVHFQGARGPKAGKVFKLAVRDLPGGKSVAFERRHRFETVSVRKIHPGIHRIEVQVNGRILGETTVDVLAPRA